jgi:hypothetical protein
MKLFITHNRLYIDTVFLCKVQHTLPEGEYRVDVTQWETVNKMTPELDNGTRIWWGVGNPQKFVLCEPGEESGFSNYQNLYKKIVDEINAYQDVTLTV